ncbi:MAG TPA: PIN domain-containing protein [Candidatus Limnocylindrales bacterium]|nr:PIN domain-containing protein [Candidatus Limnocylindrales bacterium]
MTARTFVDTNVWVYAIDENEPAKQAKARGILDPSGADELAVSTQVLGEFYVTATRKLAKPLRLDVAARMVDQMRRLSPSPVDGDDVAAAIAGSRTWQLSYWDALILVSANRAGCDRVLSEDLADGATYGRVRVENPFAEHRRISEERPALERSLGPWDDAALAAELDRYERACRDAGMRPNAVHSYWDYARRFLDWRTGAYRPRGAVGAGRPVPNGSTSVEELDQQAAAYAGAIADAGRERATVDTYERHALFFIRWLRGDFEPGRRLQGRTSSR